MVGPSHPGVYPPSTPFWHIEIRDRRLQRLLAQLKVATECRLSLWAGSSERCFENDDDGEVYTGGLGVVSRIDKEKGEHHVDFDGREMHIRFRRARRAWRSPTLPRSTRAKARNTRLW